MLRCNTSFSLTARDYFTSLCVFTFLHRQTSLKPTTLIFLGVIPDDAHVPLSETGRWTRMLTSRSMT